MVINCIHLYGITMTFPNFIFRLQNFITLNICIYMRNIDYYYYSIDTKWDVLMYLLHCVSFSSVWPQI